MEEVYTKEELLLLYLNSVPFGEDVYGVESAAQRYFGKSASKLKIEESAVLVGMLKANTYFNPQLNPAHSLARRNMVLGFMEKAQYLTSEATDSLRKLPLNPDYENLEFKVPAGYFVYQVKKKTLELLDGIKTKTGRDYNLEKDGLVERLRNSEDRRVIIVKLTPKGKSIFKNIFRKHAERVAELASVLTEEEQQQLSSLLKKLGIGLKDKQ